MGATATMGVANCKQCNEFQGSLQQVVVTPLVIVITWVLLHLDFASIEAAMDLKALSILVITDHFTGFVQSHMLPNQKVETTAQSLYDWIFPVLGAHAKILFNQGNAFESNVIKELYKMNPEIEEY